MGNFEGFAKDTRKFFEELEINNNKEWFDLNRNRYEKVVKNLSKDFVNSMSEVFSKNNLPYHADPKISLFRINRDIRFSANKNPYKTNLGIFFPHSYTPVAKKDSFAGVYFHIDANECFVGGGIYMPDPVSLKRMREKIASDYEDLQAILDDKSMKTSFPSKDRSDSIPLKKVPRGFPADHPAAEFLKLKDFSYFCDLDYDIVYSKKVLDIILDKAIVLKPLLDFFSNTYVSNLPLI